MRRCLFAATAFLIATLLAPTTSFASGNVLLPSSNDGSSGADLGLGGGSSASSSQSSTFTAMTPGSGATVPTPQSSAGGSTAGQGLETKTPIPESQPIISPIDQASAAKLPMGTIPTQVIREQNNAAFFAQANRDLPYGLTIDINGRSIFGASDVQTLADKLGLSREQIPANCIMTARGAVQTDKGSYVLAGDASPQVSFRYDGKITNYLMMATALCTADRLPPGSGYISQIDGRYSVPLQPINCPAPNRQVTKLDVTYNGTSTAQCVYQ